MVRVEIYFFIRFRNEIRGDSWDITGIIHINYHVFLIRYLSMRNILQNERHILFKGKY